MTRSEPHPQRCETCKHKLPDCDKEALGSRVCKKIFLEDPKALQIGIPYFIDIVGCASHSSHPHTPAAPATEPVKFPNSTELLLMAHTDWKNRIERKHTHDEIPWTDGWIHGYLTPKPDWKRKEQHDAAIRKDEREHVLAKLRVRIEEMGFPMLFEKTEFDDGRACAYGFFVRAIESLRGGA